MGNQGNIDAGLRGGFNPHWIVFGAVDLCFREGRDVSTTITRTLVRLREVGIAVVCHDVLRAGGRRRQP